MAKEHELEHLMDEMEEDYSSPNMPMRGVKKSQRRLATTFLATILCLSMTLNVLQATSHGSFCLSSHESATDHLSDFAGLQEKVVEVDWLQSSAYTSENETQRDHLWDAINHDSGIVAVPKTWASEKGLPMGSTFPWDTAKTIYFVNAFHGLHCIKNIYRSFMEYRLGHKQSLSPHHIIHCLDQIRSDILCTADDTLRVTTPDMRPVTGDGQIRQCRNWDALEAWTLANPGCYRYGDPEVEDVKDTQIPRMRYCHEGNPDLEKIRHYFNEGPDWRPADEKVWSWFDNFEE